MSDQEQTQEQLDQERAAEMAATELEGLKSRATMLGLQFHPSISAPKLREKIAAHLAAENSPATPAGMPAADAPAEGAVVDRDAPAQVQEGQVTAIENPSTDTVKYVLNETPAEKRRRIIRNANELVRVRVTCMNPAKKDWHGEVFTVGNNAVGTIRKFVPFNHEAGWHVPRMILEMMQNRTCQTFVNKKSVNGIQVKEGRLIKEFGIEVLPPLTEEELEQMAREQAMAEGKKG